MALHLSSFNCNGFKRLLSNMPNILQNCDIMCLQELMILKQECSILNNVHEDFYGYAVSPVDGSTGIIIGRPYGGVGFIWRKSIDFAIEIVCTDYDWLVCLKRTQDPSL